MRRSAKEGWLGRGRVADGLCHGASLRARVDFPQKYKDYYHQLDEEVKRAMREWDIRVEQARDKPRIGAFEITLVLPVYVYLCVSV